MYFSLPPTILACIYIALQAHALPAPPARGPATYSVVDVDGGSSWADSQMTVYETVPAPATTVSPMTVTEVSSVQMTTTTIATVAVQTSGLVPIETTTMNEGSFTSSRSLSSADTTLTITTTATLCFDASSVSTSSIPAQSSPISSLATPSTLTSTIFATADVTSKSHKPSISPWTRSSRSAYSSVKTVSTVGSPSSVRKSSLSITTQMPSAPVTSHASSMSLLVAPTTLKWWNWPATNGSSTYQTFTTSYKSGRPSATGHYGSVTTSINLL